MDPEQWSNRYDSGCTGWDLGRSPAELRTWAAALPPRRRILIPGCGRGYELADLVALGHEVTAIDYAEGAIAAARRSIGELAASIRCADFFACDLPSGRFDLCYERTFLCSLPRPGREEYGRRVASLLKPGGRLVGVFLYGQPEDDDPPVPLAASDRERILEAHFSLEEDRAHASGLPVFDEYAERWQVWRKRGS